MIWFGRLPAISQLASRVGWRGGIGHNPLRIITLPGSGREMRGVAFPPLVHPSHSTICPCPSFLFYSLGNRACVVVFTHCILVFSLLEALKTGSAFSRDQKRKRAPRAAGGKNAAPDNLFFSCAFKM